MNVDPGYIESAADVEPVGRPDYALVSEFESLAASQDIQPTFCGTANLSVAFPEGPIVLARIGVGNVVIEKNASILYFSVKAQPLLRLNVQPRPQAVQQVIIIRPDEADSHWTLKTITILAAEAQPARQMLVKLGYRKQPVRRIIVRIWVRRSTRLGDHFCVRARLGIDQCWSKNRLCSRSRYQSDIPFVANVKRAKQNFVKFGHRKQPRRAI